MKKIMTLALIGAVAAMPAMANTGSHMSKKGDMWFNKMDTNGDGKISRAEHDAFGTRMFNEADANNDGMLSRDEIHNDRMKHAKEDGYGYNNMAPAGGRNKPDTGGTPNNDRDSKQ